MSFTAYIASCYKHVIRNEGEFIILSKLTICFQVSPGIGAQFFFNHLYFPDQYLFLQKLYCLIFYITCFFVLLALSQLISRSLALYVISVRRTRDLLTASFRFYLTVDTLAVRLYTSHYLGVFGTCTR